MSDSIENVNPKSGSGIRVRFLAGLTLITAALVAGIGWGGFEIGGIGRDFRFVVSAALVGLALIIAFFRGGFGWRSQALFLLLLAVLGVVGYKTIRRIHLDGAMIPVGIEFVWSTTSDDRLANFRSGSSRAPLGSASWDIDPQNDFPQYRGINRDGVSLGPDLATDWTPPPRMLWGPFPVGGGFGGFAAAGGYLVTLEQRHDRETIACYDRETGREVWVHSYPAHFKDSQGGDGPRTTPTIVGDRIYSLGATGVLTCLKTSGEPVWTVNILEDAGAANLSWGMAGSPLVVDNLVVVNPGNQDTKSPNCGVVAYDANTGDRVWATDVHNPAGYSSPQLSTIAGTKQIVIFDGHGVAGLNVADGKQLWRYPWRTNQGINCAQPAMLKSDQLFVSSGYLVGGALLKLVPRSDGPWTVEKVWSDRRSMQCKFCNPICYRGAIFGANDVRLCCVDAETGKTKWKGPEIGYGQIVRRGDSILAVTETGEVIHFAADPGKYRELGRFKVFDQKTWNTPCLAGNHLYLRNQWNMACLELPLAKSNNGTSDKIASTVK